jgi:carboxymethylenebutenolidase
MQQYLVHEFVKDYEDGLLSRRGMVGRVLHITGGVAAAAGVLTALGIRAGGAQESTVPMPDGPQSPFSVAADDAGVTAEEITFPGGDGTSLMAFQAAPSPSAATPAATAAWSDSLAWFAEHLV